MYSSDELQKAFNVRDPRYDGRFYVGVKTTQVYCRVVCPARPKIQNVLFFRSQAEAENSKFRPCLRCRPDISPEHSMWDGTGAVVNRAVKLISEGSADEISLEKLAERVGVTGRHLRRLFDRHLGASPIDVVTSKRLHSARLLLSQTRIPVTNIAFASGFSSIRQFNTAFKARYHKSPRDFRKTLPLHNDFNDEITFRIPVMAPYDWNYAYHVYESHPVKGIDRCADGTYSRLLNINGRPVRIEISFDEGRSELAVKVDGAEITDLREILATVRRVFDTQLNPHAVEVNSKIKLNGLRIPGAFDPFETAVCIILGQLVSTEQAARKCAKLVELYGEAVKTEREGLTHFFPTPKKLSDVSLREIGLTKMRERAIRELSRAVFDGTIQLGATADFEQTRKQLLEIDGIGPWTAEMITMRCLGDTNAFPAQDLIVRRAIEKFKLRQEDWSPWRSYLCLWIWKNHALTLSKKGKRK